MNYTRSVCGKTHEGLPDVGADAPFYYYDVPERERAARLALTSDTCALDDEHFFIRGVIELLIHDSQEAFGFGVWVSLAEKNYDTYLSNFDSDGIGPFFGWLCTRIDYYSEDTLFLKTRVHFRGGGQRPLVELESTEHPLAVDQGQGINLDKAWDIVHYYDTLQSVEAHHES